MPKLSHKFGNKSVQRFKSWLGAAGADLLLATNDYEVVRFKCQNGTGVIYKNNKGVFSASNDVAAVAVECFLTGKHWDGKEPTARRKPQGKHAKELIKRDGESCFFCLRDDVNLTVEHVVSICQGGPDKLVNKVLACEPCQGKAGRKSIAEKFRLRERALGLSTNQQTNHGGN